MINSIISIALLLGLNNIYTNEKRIKLIPSGDNILFKMNSNGVIVTGTYDYLRDNKLYSLDGNISKGDIIYQANGNKVANIQDLLKEVNESNTLSLKIKRGNDILSREIPLYQENDKKITGLYVKDYVVGVGTLTYIDPNSSYFCALGHEVVDNDTKKKLEITNGEIYLNDVISISKGENHNPGEKISKISFEEKVGKIFTNTNFGIFGKYEYDYSKKNALEIAYSDEVEKSDAYVLTCIKNKEVKPYKIKIIETKKNDSQTKNFTFKIVDKELLNVAGGVYSGMSGSPIIQNNRIIGAITHVLVDRIEYGYGLYIENMISEEKNILRQ